MRITQKNEFEILALRKENEEMKRKFVEGGLSAGPTNLVGRSFTTLSSPKTVEEPKEKIHFQEVDDKSYPNKSIPTTSTLDSVRRHPFIDSIIVMTVRPT